jgi:hypothetical protein
LTVAWLVALRELHLKALEAVPHVALQELHSKVGEKAFLL